MEQIVFSGLGKAISQGEEKFKSQNNFTPL